MKPRGKARAVCVCPRPLGSLRPYEDSLFKVGVREYRVETRFRSDDHVTLLIIEILTFIHIYIIYR